MSDYTPRAVEFVGYSGQTSQPNEAPQWGHFTADFMDEVQRRFDRWLSEHDAKVRAEALREAYADLQAYTDSGAPFGHRPVEEFLLHRADRIEREAGLK